MHKLTQIGAALAVLAAFAAVGPAQATDDNCHKTGDGWIRDTQVKCSFSCDAYDLILLSLDAADKDARVDGSGECAGEQAWCVADQSCEGDAGPTRAPDRAGLCSGRAYEAVPDALTIRCSSYPSRCVPAALSICAPNADGAIGTATTVVTIEVGPNEADATICVRGGGCRTVVPQCVFAPDVGLRACWVGPSVHLGVGSAAESLHAPLA